MNSQNSGCWVYTIFGIIALMMVLAFGCTDKPGTTKVLMDQGFTEIEINKAPKYLSCGESDWYRTGFTAVSPTGASVSGTVCKGLFFKGQTIRFD